MGLQVALNKRLQGHAWVSALPSDLDQECCVTSDRGAASKLNNVFPVASAYQLITMSLESYSGEEHGEGTDREYLQVMMLCGWEWT